MKTKVILNKDITEEEFLIATFDDIDFELGSFDIESMKTTTLNGDIGEGGLDVEVLKRNGDTFIFTYSNDSMSIWDNVDDLEEVQ